MYLLVTGTAKRHQVQLIVRPTLGERNDVVDFLHSDIPSVLQTHLTKRMLACVTMSDAYPSSAVLLVRVGTACVFVVLLRGKSLMLLAVLTVLDSQPWTSACSAPAPWSPRHTNHLAFQA